MATRNRSDTSLYFIAVVNGAPNMYGGRPMFHKTHKGAARYARGARGRVLAMDLAFLPEVVDDQVAVKASVSALEFAERQMLAWGNMIDRIKRGVDATGMAVSSRLATHDAARENGEGAE